MSKAILIMDMPKCCGNCKLKSKIHGIANVEFCCNLAEGMITLNNAFKERLANCPLKEMPQKKEEIEMDISHAESVEMGYREGYNTCISEILKGSE